jgi:hypothetical protein
MCLKLPPRACLRLQHWAAEVIAGCGVHPAGGQGPARRSLLRGHPARHAGQPRPPTAVAAVAVLLLLLLLLRAALQHSAAKDVLLARERLHLRRRGCCRRNSIARAGTAGRRATGRCRHAGRAAELPRWHLPADPAKGCAVGTAAAGHAAHGAACTPHACGCKPAAPAAPALHKLAGEAAK